MTDQTRAAFEAHFQLTQRQAWQHKDGSYQFPEIQAKWEGWQAGLAASGTDKNVLIEDLTRKHATVFEICRDNRKVIAEQKAIIDHLKAQLAAAAPGAVPVAIRGCFNGTWFYGPWSAETDMTSEWEPLYAAPVAAAAPGEGK